MDELREGTSVWTAEQWSKFSELQLKPYLDWYMKVGVRFVAYSRISSVVAFTCGIAATITAAMPTEDLGWGSRHDRALVSWSVVIFSALATSLTAAHGRFLQIARMREAGRVAITQVEQEAKMAMIFSPMAMGERASYLSRLPAAIAAVERQFGSVMDTTGGGRPFRRIESLKP